MNTDFRQRQARQARQAIEAWIAPVSRATTLENGGRMSNVAEEAVDATIARVGTRS